MLQEGKKPKDFSPSPEAAVKPALGSLRYTVLLCVSKTTSVLKKKPIYLKFTWCRYRCALAGRDSILLPYF